MHVQSCSFAFSTLCFFDVLVAVAVLASQFPHFQTVYQTIFQDMLDKGREGGLNSLEQVQVSA